MRVLNSVQFRTITSEDAMRKSATRKNRYQTCVTIEKCAQADTIRIVDWGA